MALIPASGTDLTRLIAAAQARFAALSPEQQAAELRAQRRSWVLAEIAFGDEADEAAYAAAVARGDSAKLARLEEASTERVRRAMAHLDQLEREASA